MKGQRVGVKGINRDRRRGTQGNRRQHNDRVRARVKGPHPAFDLGPRPSALTALGTDRDFLKMNPLPKNFIDGIEAIVLRIRQEWISV